MFGDLQTRAVGSKRLQIPRDAFFRLGAKGTKGLKADAKRKVVSAGNALYVVVESIGKGGGKTLMGRPRFTPGRTDKHVEVRSMPLRQGG